MTRSVPKQVRNWMAGDPCVYCGEPSTQVDHLDSVAGGGGQDIGNFAPTCHTCNTYNGSDSALLFLARRRAGGSPSPFGDDGQAWYFKRKPAFARWRRDAEERAYELASANGEI